MKNSELRSLPPDTKAATKHGVSKFMVLVIPTQGKQCDFEIAKQGDSMNFYVSFTLK